MMQENNRNYKELFNIGIHNCFGCSPSNKFGLQMKLFTDEEAVYSWLSVPDYLGGWKNIVHGGIVSTILDEIMGWAGLYFLKKITLTNSMTVDFMRAVLVGEKLKAEGKVIDYDGKRNVLVEGYLYNEKNALCAKAKGKFTALSPKLAKRLDMMTDDQIKDFFEPLINQ